jgi:hypothetical protein
MFCNIIYTALYYLINKTLTIYYFIYSFNITFIFNLIEIINIIFIILIINFIFFIKYFKLKK